MSGQKSLPVCGDCEEGVAKYPDPRHPPLDVGNCLCGDCAVVAFNDAIYDASEEVRGLERQAEKLGLKIDK
jgi:hypothetical protein